MAFRKPSEHAASELTSWQELVRKLRDARERGDASAAATARNGLLLAMELRGRQAVRFRSFLRSFGEVRFDQCLQEALRGRWHRRHQPAPGEEDRPIPEPERRLSDDRWYAGIIDHFEWEPEMHANPLGVFDVAFERRLIDESKRKPGPEIGTRRIGTESEADDPEGPQPIVPVGDPIRTYTPTKVPSDVARTLREAAAFSALVLRILPSLPPEHGLRAVEKPALGELQTLVKHWVLLDEYVMRDVQLATERLRWKEQPRGTVGGPPAKDLWARAWQATYHESEGHEELVDQDEIPDHGAAKAAANQFYAHLSRFRSYYKTGAEIASAVVAAGRQRDVRSHVVERRGRLPIEWEPATHASLEG